MFPPPPTGSPSHKTTYAHALEFAHSPNFRLPDAYHRNSFSQHAVSKLNLVDLAGSERQAKTNTKVCELQFEFATSTPLVVTPPMVTPSFLKYLNLLCLQTKWGEGGTSQTSGLFFVFSQRVLFRLGWLMNFCVVGTLTYTCACICAEQSTLPTISPQNIGFLFRPEISFRRFLTKQFSL